MAVRPTNLPTENRRSLKNGIISKFQLTEFFSSRMRYFKLLISLQLLMMMSNFFQLKCGFS